ncbi:DinB family protein [Exiguobacterium sp. s28]|uniref:DinB family protein n=1 Tax=Exiguobacterium sp. s28 TaxID=2751238 RepID=UPI001BE8CACD|nr:DinB family protein [Exiguobacterium sp. s28]
MPDKTNTLHLFSTYLEWLDSLIDIDEATWDTPLATGKWSMKAIILHMTNWDDYLMRETVPALQTGREVVFPEFDAFNQRAIDQVERGISSHDVLAEARSTRQTLIESIERRGTLSADAEATLFHILEEFIEHDRHHEHQIDTFLHRSGQEKPS